MSDIHELIERELAIHFTQNRQPHMSGDPRERLSAMQRRNMEDARDAVIAALGIPVETLRGLRDGSLVAVPRENNDTIRRAVWLAQYRHANSQANTQQPDAHCVALAEERVQSYRQRASDQAAWAAMLAAAQEPPRGDAPCLRCDGGECQSCLGNER